MLPLPIGACAPGTNGRVRCVLCCPVSTETRLFAEVPTRARTGVAVTSYSGRLCGGVWIVDGPVPPFLPDLDAELLELARPHT